MHSAVKDVDVAIIGGGPAGISAALWCDELGLRSVLIEQERALGGQLRHVDNPIENYLGVSAADGQELLSRFEKSVRSRNFVRLVGIKATSLDLDSKQIDLAAEGGRSERLRYQAIILATGVRRRTLGIPGEIDFRGKGVLESGARDKQQASGKRVLIVGGGDAAFENAVMLSEVASSVRVAYRRDEPSAREEFVNAANRSDNVGHLSATVVTAILGNSAVEKVELKDSVGRIREERVDVILIRIGVDPNSELLAGVAELDDAGYVSVNDSGETSVAGIYAVGDVAHRYSPTLSTATGTAATTVKAIFHSIGK